MTKDASERKARGYGERPALIVALVVLAVAGCQQAHTVAPEGTSSFRFVDLPATAVRGEPKMATEVRQPVDVLEPAQPIEPLALPVYPAAARGKQRIPITVGVRLTIAADGTVSEVGHSPVAFSMPGPFASEFRGAVEQAVTRWRFVPAELRHMVPKVGGPEKAYWHVTRAEKQDSFVDVQFTFTPSGEVVSGSR